MFGTVLFVCYNMWPAASIQPCPAVGEQAITRAGKPTAASTASSAYAKGYSVSILARKARDKLLGYHHGRAD